MPVAFHLSLPHASGLPPFTGLHWWPLSLPHAGGLPTITSVSQWPAACHRCTPVPYTCHWCTLVAFCLSLAHASGLSSLPPVAGTCQWPFGCYRHAGSLLSVTSMCLWTSHSQWHEPVAFPLSPACLVTFYLSLVRASGLPPVTGMHQCPSNCHQCAPMPSACHWHMPLAFCLSLACASAHLFVTSP